MSIEQPVEGDAGSAAAEDVPVATEAIEPAQPKKSSNAARGFLLFLFMLAALYGGARLFANRDSSTSASTPTRVSQASSDPYETFQTVRNDCGVCGTNSPVGGWEAADGRALVLSDDGDFVIFHTDDTTQRGAWTRSDGQLCLSPATGGRVCFSYQQKIDAMKLDNAIYIRK